MPDRKKRAVTRVVPGRDGKPRKQNYIGNRLISRTGSTTRAQRRRVKRR
jgi:hypothetical protein